MTRVAIIIGTSLAFAILGLIAGHLCISVYSGNTVLDAGGHAIRVSATGNLDMAMVISCYLGPPFVGAFTGLLVSLIALKGLR